MLICGCVSWSFLALNEYCIVSLYKHTQRNDNVVHCLHVLSSARTVYIIPNPEFLLAGIYFTLQAIYYNQYLKM